MLIAVIMIVVTAMVVAIAIGTVCVLVLPWKCLQRKRCVVNLLDGQTFVGLLWARRGPLLVLRDASRVGPDGPVHVPGDVVLERQQVAWVQVVT